MNKQKLEKLDDHLEKVRPLLAMISSLLVIVTGIIKGISLWGFNFELLGWLLILIGLALFLLLFYYIFDKVLSVWDKITEWLTPDLRRYPYLRMFLVVATMMIGFYLVYYLFVPFKFHLILKIIVAIYTIFISPAVITSLVREDLKKENTVLAEKVSRSVRIDNPQAAIQNAFTHFEDHLNKRIQGGDKLFSSGLIKAAYDGENSKLQYKIGEKDHTQHLYQLMAGAYSLLRNPRHHKIIEDSEEKAQVIISLTEMLIEFVDESTERKV
jgi:hypothetical protein